MKYFVTIGERVIEVAVDGDVVTVDGGLVHATLASTPASPEIRLSIDGTDLRLAVDSSLEGTWRLVDHGAVREIKVEDERHRHIRLMAGSGKAAGGETTLKAPMPGLVVRVTVAAGDPVSAGMGLVVLEAMKMENELKAAAPGVVRTVLVAPGQAVEKGEVLLELGPAT